MPDRRRYRRVAANILSRPAGIALFHHQRKTRDISLGGMRVLADDRFSVGSRLDADVLLPTGEPVRCWVEVVWIQQLAHPNPGHGQRRRQPSA